MYKDLTLHDLAKCLQVEIAPQLSSLPFTGISTDSRTLNSGEVFFAIRGPNFNGNDFVEKALQIGAPIVIAETSSKNPRVLSVPDSLQALIAVARHLRGRFAGPVLGITGSAGKSSTKQMTATLLGEHTVSSPASFNNLLGLSKTCLLIDETTEACVFEMGMNAPGEIRELCEQFGPQFGLITNIGDAHLGKLGSVENIRLAKKELFEYIAIGGKGIALNIDDSRILQSFEECRGLQSQKCIKYSVRSQQADVVIEKRMIDPKSAYLRVTVKVFGVRSEHSIPIFGLHHGENIAAALAAGVLLDRKPEDLIAKIHEIRPAHHRGEIYALENNVTLIDESYNSNPRALISSIESLSELAPQRRRVLILGEMRELADFSEKLHLESGQTIARLHQLKGIPFTVIGVGKDAQFLVQGIQQHSKASTHLCEDWKAAGELAQGMLKPNDIVLVKSSRGGHLDLCVDELLKAWGK